MKPPPASSGRASVTWISRSIAPRHFDGCAGKAAAPQLEEVGDPALGDHAVHGVPRVGAEREKGDLSRAYPIRAAQAGREGLVGKIGLFEHGGVLRGDSDSSV